LLASVLGISSSVNAEGDLNHGLVHTTARSFRCLISWRGCFVSEAAQQNLAYPESDRPNTSFGKEAESDIDGGARWRFF
jgi:hypothetical protein